MSITPTGDDSMNSDDRQYDNLTVLTGLSPARQTQLRKFGICTWLDLARLSDEKAESVAEGIKGVSSDMLKGWRAEAQERLGLPPSEQTSTNSEGEANSPATESAWKSFASFLVVVQARQMKDGTREQRIWVRHQESGEEEDRMEWSGISTQPWEWIVAQVGETEEVMPEAKEGAHVEASSAESPPTQVPQAKVKVTHIHAYQPAHAHTPVGVGKAGDLFRGTVRASEPFALEASFELVETTGAEVAKMRGTYRAKFYARDWSTGERLDLNGTETEPLENKSPHTAKLPSVTLSPGNYKLQVLVQLQDPLRALGFLEVPLLQVV